MATTSKSSENRDNIKGKGANRPKGGVYSEKPLPTHNPPKKEQKRKSEHRELAKHRDAFEAWYAANRSVRAISRSLAVPERTLYDWADWFKWHDLADKRDAEAARIADRKAAQERAKRIEQQRKAGTLLRQRGTQHFVENETIADPRVAIQAIKTGTEMERQADGLPDWVLKVYHADESELDRLEQLINERLAADEDDDSDEAGGDGEED